MDLTQNKFENFKQDYQVFKQAAEEDKYGNEVNTYSPSGTVHCMWTPITDEASIKIYGQDVQSMLQAILYDGDISQFDQVEINGQRYEVVSVMTYQTHRVIKVKKVIR